MSKAYFLTGTDTEIGKTHTACALLHAWRNTGLSAVGYKPLAAGAERVGDEFANEDAVRLHAASSPGFSLAEINPVCLPEPIAPHIAAANTGVRIDLATMLGGYAQLQSRADRILVEGVGGFCVPLDDDRDTSHLAMALGLPVIMVVGMRLGCLNHALLTAEAIEARGLRLIGWIANAITPDMPYLEDNVAALRSRLAARCLGVLPHGLEPGQAAAHLTLPA
ncbi:dethiobiotin synthase [Uliginosibacterium sp. sgz301328]|uniref:dethiobiotin synthase n=1 Tax=Uliginosibacterium sp. sgz301328 TaxID=3243764 RepID=UPI00359D6E5B